MASQPFSVFVVSFLNAENIFNHVYLNTLWLCKKKDIVDMSFRREIGESGVYPAIQQLLDRVVFYTEPFNSRYQAQPAIL